MWGVGGGGWGVEEGAVKGGEGGWGVCVQAGGGGVGGGEREGRRGAVVV